MIRTRSNHLLGPISKEKLVELMENGSIHTDDEICAGNGYWFYLRETDLVNKYIYSEVIQSFNPVSEALNEMRLRNAGILPRSAIKHNNMPNGNISFDDDPDIITQVIPLEKIENKGRILEDLQMPEFKDEKDN